MISVKFWIASILFLGTLLAQDMEPVVVLPGQQYTAPDTVVIYNLSQTRKIRYTLRVAAEKIERYNRAVVADSAYIVYLESVVEKQKELSAAQDEIITGQSKLLKHKRNSSLLQNGYVGYLAGILSVYLAAQVLGSVK